MDIKFMGFRGVRDQKFKGIVTVLVNGTIYLKYKLVTNTKTGRDFLASPSVPKGEGEYEDAFAIDSRALEEEIRTIVFQELGKPKEDDFPF